MATNASVICKFSDGSVLMFRNAVTLGTATEVKSDNSGTLNQAGDISFGQIAQGRILTHAAVKIQKDNGADGAFGFAPIIGVGGNIISCIQGGGTLSAGLPRLKKPVRVETGQKILVMAQAVTDAAKFASLSVYTASGKYEVFQVLAVDGTATAMTSYVGGNTIGEALAGEKILCYMATYPASYGLADNTITDGLNALYVEDSKGQTKALMYTAQGTGQTDLVQWVEDSFMVAQNDTLTVKANI